MSTNGAGKADHTVAPQHESDSDPVLACAYCTNAVTTRSKTRREKVAFAELRAQALAEQPKYVALHQELNELEVHVGEELPLFASLAGKLQLLEGIDRYYDAIRLYVCSFIIMFILPLVGPLGARVMSVYDLGGSVQAKHFIRVLSERIVGFFGLLRDADT